MLPKRRISRALLIVLISTLLITAVLLLKGGLAGASRTDVQGSRGAPHHLSTPAPRQSSSAAQNRAVIYTYDDAGRLVEANYGDKSITYTYDDAGNLLSRKIETKTKVYLPLVLRNFAP